MKVIDYLSTANDNENVTIYRDGIPVAYYDGRDSIPEELNNEIIILISRDADGIEVNI